MSKTLPTATGSTAQPPARSTEPLVTGAADRPWHMRAWSGITFGAWCSVLARHGFRISPSRIPMAGMLTGISLINSTLAGLQHLLYRQRIEDTELSEQPLFVLGHWRSGTTLLHEMLVQDSQFTFPNTFACFSPNHFLLSEGWLKRMIGPFLPRQRPMDNMAIGWDLPQEDEWALCNMGQPSPYFKILFPNLKVADAAYYSLRDLSPEKRASWQQQLLWFLKCLTVREGKRIVLKTPVHTFRVATLLELFPRAQFIHITRDPHVVIPSTMHTWRKMYRYHGLQVPKFEHLEQEVLEAFTEMYVAFERDKQSLAPENFYQLSYENLTSQPLAEMEKLYSHLGLPLSQATRNGWQAYADRSGDYQTNRYVLNPELQASIDQHCRAYALEYGYSHEDQT